MQMLVCWGSSYPQQHYNKMTELKTLKDLEQGINTDGYSEEHLISIFELKQEAIKWIKALIEEDDYMGRHLYTANLRIEDLKESEYSDKTIGVSWEECSDIRAIIVFIKHFFNLTGDELK
jgi:hypothetical protein